MSNRSHRNSISQRSKYHTPGPSNFNSSQQQWIGQEVHSTPQSPAYPESKSQQPSRTIQKFKETGGLSVGNKSPVELMQDILRMVGDGQENWIYYSKEAQENLGQLLTNRFKLNNYIKKLESDMVGLDSSVVKNYQILILLLGQLSGADVQVRQGEEGLEVKFNRSLIERQQAEIERLEREKEERQKQIKYYIEEYESIIFNFNDVIEKLVNKEEAIRLKGKY